jgi:hypothetical protein
VNSVGTFPRHEKRENIGAQIAVSVCILLLPPILAFAVLAPHPHRSESGEAPHAREPVAESTSTSVPITEESLHPPSLSRQLSGTDPPFEDRFAAALDYADDIDGHPSAIHEESPILPSSQLPTHGDRVQSVPAVRFLPRNFALNVSTCFPSASAVRRDHPEAWPSWTLRAPGHEGTKCWYAAMRPTAHDHRAEIPARNEIVGQSLDRAATK